MNNCAICAFYVGSKVRFLYIWCTSSMVRKSRIRIKKVTLKASNILIIDLAPAFVRCIPNRKVQSDQILLELFYSISKMFFCILLRS